MNYNLSDHKSGDTFPPVTFQLVVDDGNDTPIDLTGASIKMQVRKEKTEDSILTCSTTDSTILITDENLGKFKLQPGVVTVTEESNYYYDIQVTIGTTVKTYLEGRWKIELDVTR